MDTGNYIYPALAKIGVAFLINEKWLFSDKEKRT